MPKQLAYIAAALMLVLSQAFAQEFNYNYAYTNIDFPGADRTATIGINAAGEIVGWYHLTSESDPFKSHGFLRNNKGEFTTFDFPGATTTLAFSVNSKRQIVGSYDSPPYEAPHGFMFDFNRGVFTPIDVPGSTNTQCRGINESGQIIGQYRLPNNTFHSFLLDQGVFTEIVYPGAIFTQASAITQQGKILGRYVAQTGDSRIFILDNGVYTTVPGISGNISPNDMNARGVIVGERAGDFPLRAFVLDNGTLTIFWPKPTWLELLFFGINERGQAVGEYVEEVVYRQVFRQHGVLIEYKK